MARAEWEADQRSVAQVPHIQELLQSNTVHLMQAVDPSDELLAHMYQHKVITAFQKETIEAEKVPHMRVQKILDFIRRSSVGQFHQFMSCLINTNQAAVVEHLGLPLTDYSTAQISASPTSLSCSCCQEQLTQAYISTCCQQLFCPPCRLKYHPRCGACSKVIQPGTFQLEEQFTELNLVLQFWRSSTASGTWCTVGDHASTAAQLIHSCDECGGMLCGQCVTLHADVHADHPVQHFHQENFCCQHGKAVLNICKTCKTSCCLECLKSCKSHDREALSHNKKGDWLHNFLEAIKSKKKANYAEKQMMDREMDQQKLKKYIKIKSEEVRRTSHDWISQVLTDIRKMKKEVETGSLREESQSFVMEIDSLLDTLKPKIQDLQ